MALSLNIDEPTERHYHAVAQMSTGKTSSKYGLNWPEGTQSLEIEFSMIRRGGDYKQLLPHYREAMHLCWPEDDWHRWSELFLERVLKNKVTGFMGPGNSNKTYSAAKFDLIDYWCFPDNTLHLVSSTDARGLELRVWGAIKKLYNRATRKFRWLPGNILETIHCITTDDIEDVEEDERKRGRELTKGIICIPCLQAGATAGLSKYVGIKQSRIRLTADECQLMSTNFLEAMANLAGNPDFKGVFLGNPIDPTDPLGTICEPIFGWESQPEPTKTSTWATKLGECVNFVGTDSPNYDFPELTKPKYPYMIHKWRVKEIEEFWGKDSQQYYSQAVGVMKSGLLDRRIITKELCRQHHATDKAFWSDDKHTKVHATDIAYGGVGGDRCVSGWAEFGESLDGGVILRLNMPQIVPISIKEPENVPEDQIANYIKRDIEDNGIDVRNTGYDSTGRGTMGQAFAKIFGHQVPVAIEFGGRPTRRPVRHDLFVLENDGKTRLKRCDEHYLDMVSELWFTTREAIRSNQIRELPEIVMNEGCKKEWGTAPGNKLYVESKHPEKPEERARLLMKNSPDFYDWFVGILEMARRAGFQIKTIGKVLVENDNPYEDWNNDADDYEKAVKSSLLTYV